MDVRALIVHKYFKLMLSKMQKNVLHSIQYYEGPKKMSSIDDPIQWENHECFTLEEKETLHWLIDNGYVYEIDAKAMSIIEKSKLDCNNKMPMPWALEVGNLDYTPQGYEALAMSLAESYGYYQNYTHMSFRAWDDNETWVYIRNVYLIWVCLDESLFDRSIEKLNPDEYVIESDVKFNIAHYEFGHIGCRVAKKCLLK